MISDLDVALSRENNTIFINDNQASVTFYPRDPTKTHQAVIEKCVQLDSAFVTGSAELSQLEQSVSQQLAQIYKEANGKAKKITTRHVVVPNAPSVKKLDITLEDWQTGLAERLQKLKNITNKNFPQVWPSVEFVLAVSRILYIADITLPFMGIILGRPSSSKTLAIECFRGASHTFYTDAFTPRSFVSHNSGLSEEQLREIDLLPKIKDSIFLTPELAPVFTAKEEEITSLFGMITRILDGHGYESDTGAQGHRGYSGEYMFVWVGAVVEVPFKIFKILGTLGPKLYFFRLKTDEKTEEAYEQEMQDDNFVERRNEVKAALVDYLEFFLGCPVMVESGRLPKVVWNKDQENRAIRLIIVRLAKLLAHLRGTVPTWDTKDTGGAQYAYALPTIEDPSRAMTQLRNLARGHALLEGRTSVGIEDMSLLVNVALSTAPIERVTIFDLLLAHDGSLTTSDITSGINVSAPTAKRTMAELTALGLVVLEHETEKANSEYRITLKDDFGWFLGREFKLLKENHLPRREDVTKTESLEDASSIGGGQNSFDTETPKEKDPPRRDEIIPCPYCSAAYETEQEVIDHSIRSHPGEPVTAALAARMEAQN